MALKSAISLDPGLFAPSAISADTHAFNQKLMDIMSKGPKWYEASRVPDVQIICLMPTRWELRSTDKCGQMEKVSPFPESCSE